MKKYKGIVIQQEKDETKYELLEQMHTSYYSKTFLAIENGNVY